MKHAWVWPCIMKFRKTNIILFLLACAAAVTAQPATDFFTVSGIVKKDLRFNIADLEKQTSVPVPDVTITNHVGEQRGTASKLKGILIKDLLKDLELAEDNPKLFSEFYFVFIASDGYKVVYSWNEIFNSPTGNNLYLITSKDGQSLSNMTERMLVLTTTDYRTGRRFIKGLSKIAVERAR